MTALDFYKERLKERGFSDKQIKDLTDHKDLPWLQFAEDYHKKQLMLGGVVGRSEQLVCHHKSRYTLKSDGNCCKCHLPPNPNAK